MYWVLSERAGGDVVVLGVRDLLQADCKACVKVDIRSFHPEVKVSKLVKWFKRYSHFKIRPFSPEISVRCPHSISTCQCPYSRPWQVLWTMMYRIIPNRSTGCLDKSLEGGYIRFREPGATVTNIIYKRNRPSKLGGASIRRGAFIGDNTVCFIMKQVEIHIFSNAPLSHTPVRLKSFQ